MWRLAEKIRIKRRNEILWSNNCRRRNFFGKKKKLKKIPYDLVSYIQIETETIEDADDKMMIASYCLGKLQLVEWYIQLIDTNNPNYIVPQTREQLVMIRDQLKECHKEIMKVKIKRPGERPLFDIRYLDE